MSEPSENLIQVQACKYDGRVHRRWSGRLARRSGSLLVLEAVFEEEIRHPLLGTIRPGTLSTEYFWTERWYSIFRFRQPTGELRNYYCNVQMPPRLEGRLLSFIDLDIDVLVAPDLTYEVLDEEEFTAHAALYQYPEEVRRQARAAVPELISLINGRRFPFDAQAV